MSGHPPVEHAIGPASPEEVFLRELDQIDRITGSICSRHRLPGDERDDFRSWVRLKLIENDYAVFRKFQGRSSLGTYLTVVIANCFRDYRVAQWGRWRPSVFARRNGPLAVRLEELVSRDGYSIDQAIQALRSETEVGHSDRELMELAAGFPERGRPREASDEALALAPDDHGADDDLLRHEREGRFSEIIEVLERAMEDLPDEDRLILRLHYWDGLKVAQIARSLQLEQRPLYPRIEKIRHALQGVLEESGVSREVVMTFFHETDA